MITFRLGSRKVCARHTGPAIEESSATARHLERLANVILCTALGAITAVVATVPINAEALDDAAEQYRPYMIKDIDQALASARELRERVASNDVAGAQDAWVASRIGWERSEVFTSGFVPELDDAIDAWPDATKGFHGIEAKLFGARSVDVRPETDALILHLADLDQQIRNIKLTAQGLLNGVTRLAYEIGDSKVDGGESRFSGTSLNDMRNNIDGIELAYRILFASALEAGDPKLADRTRNGIKNVKALLSVQDLKEIDPNTLRKTSEDLVVTLQSVGPKLGLNTPTLEETPK